MGDSEKNIAKNGNGRLDVVESESEGRRSLTRCNSATPNPTLDDRTLWPLQISLLQEPLERFSSWPWYCSWSVQEASLATVSKAQESRFERWAVTPCRGRSGLFRNFGTSRLAWWTLFKHTDKPLS
jgi:hypothetical protein